MQVLPVPSGMMPVQAVTHPLGVVTPLPLYSTWVPLTNTLPMVGGWLFTCYGFVTLTAAF